MATFVSVTTPEFDFTQQVPSHAVHFVKLTFVSAEGTRVRILQEPPVLALNTYRFLANFTLQRVFENVVAYSTD